MMSNKPYSIYPRKRKNGKPVYYAQFRLPSGKWSTAKSTGETSKNRAENWCIEYLQAGQVVFKENVSLHEFTGNDFFSYGSEWEKNKRFSKKKSPSPRWCLERTEMLKNHIIPALGEYRLSLITEEVIINFRNNLCAGTFGKKYSGAFTNKILFALRDILKAAAKKNLIKSIPEIELAEVKEKHRGRLSQHETELLFSFQWNDERSYIACLIAASTGAKLSEIQALRINDIKPDGTITICKAWERRTKQVKDRTKNNKHRKVQLAESICNRLLQYFEKHPYRNDNGFIIYSNKSKDYPACEQVIMKSFHKALEEIGITKEIRQNKGLCFHSFRYFCNSVLIESGVPAETVRERLGHCSDRMTQKYFKSEDTDIMASTIETVLPLPRTLDNTTKSNKKIKH
ncbi:MAG: tyrosine-type recombinase/integrase [bacterium]|nr:tyrosine-type recombinase/integrase [bacterium]